MENFNQLENKKAFRKMILIIGGIILLAVITTVFLLFRKGSKETFDSEISNPGALVSPTASGGEKPLFSEDIATWKNYHWSGKLNTHYPSDWQFKEEIADNGLVVGLNIIPLTDSIEDVIFIGGVSAKCSDVLKYSKNECLKNKIQVPFYTNSKNQEVLAAFDLIFQNSILTEEEK